MGKGGGGEEKASLLQLSPFFASIFSFNPRKILNLSQEFHEGKKKKNCAEQQNPPRV